MARARGSQIYSPEVMEGLKTIMAKEGRLGVDDEATFGQKMNALQRFLNHGMSRFSIEVWHHTLLELFQLYQKQHDKSESRRHAQPPVLTGLHAVTHLRLLSRDVILQRDGGSLRDADMQALKHLDGFLSAVQCLREANKCFTQLYTFLYRYYYDPGRAQSAAADKAGPEQNAYEISAKQFGILTLKQMSGSTDHKLRRTVRDMSEILSRWERIVNTEDELNPHDFDAESQQDLMLLATTASFEPVLRLLPDVFSKFYKCLELAKQWWVLSHDIYSELPINRPPTPLLSPTSSFIEMPGQENKHNAEVAVNSDSQCSDTVSEKVEGTKLLQQVENEIASADNLLQSLYEESELLEKRERHFESLIEAYEKVNTELNDKTTLRKDLVAQREKLSFPPENQLPPRMTAPLTDVSSKNSVNSLDGIIASTDRQIQLLQFQRSLLLQDYMLQLEVRPSLIRFSEDLRQRTEAAQRNLTEHKDEKLKLQSMLVDSVAKEDYDGTDGQLFQLDNNIYEQDTSRTSVGAPGNISGTSTMQENASSRLERPHSQLQQANISSQTAQGGSEKLYPTKPELGTSTKATGLESNHTETLQSQLKVDPQYLPVNKLPNHRSIARPRARSDPHTGKSSQQILSKINSRGLSTAQNTSDAIQQTQKPNKVS